MDSSILFTYQMQVQNPSHGLVPDEPEFVTIEAKITEQSSFSEIQQWYDQKKDQIKTQDEQFIRERISFNWSNSERSLFSKAMMMVRYLEEEKVNV